MILVLFAAVVVCMFVHLFFCLVGCLFICLFVCLFARLFVHFVSVCLLLFLRFAAAATVVGFLLSFRLFRFRFLSDSLVVVLFCCEKAMCYICAFSFRWVAVCACRKRCDVYLNFNRNRRIIRINCYFHEVFQSDRDVRSTLKQHSTQTERFEP